MAPFTEGADWSDRPWEGTSQTSLWSPLGNCEAGQGLGRRPVSGIRAREEGAAIKVPRCSR